MFVTLQNHFYHLQWILLLVGSACQFQMIPLKIIYFDKFSFLPLHK